MKESSKSTEKAFVLWKWIKDFKELNNNLYELEVCEFLRICANGIYDWDRVLKPAIFRSYPEMKGEWVTLNVPSIKITDRKSVV